MKAPEVSTIPKYTTADGRLTIEGMKLFKSMLAILADHESRIAALEP